jgi:hypothetical protein
VRLRRYPAASLAASAARACLQGSGAGLDGGELLLEVGVLPAELFEPGCVGEPEDLDAAVTAVGAAAAVLDLPGDGYGFAAIGGELGRVQA